MDQGHKYISRDRSCKEFSIKFSCVYPIQGFSLKSTLRLLSCNIKMLKNKLWIRRITIEAEVVIIRGNQVVKETTLLKEIRRNQTSVVATISQKTNSNISNKSQGRYQVRITRGLNKKSLIHSYTIYTKSSWSMLIINSPILISMCNPFFHHIVMT